MPQRTYHEIQKKIDDGSAVVMTAQELLDSLEEGNRIAFEDVDVVTTATKGLMSGTSAILGFRVAEPKKFTKVKQIWLNGIEAYPGPAPNETLGVVDLTIFGTHKSRDDPNYGGGHLFRDLVERKPIHVSGDSVEGVHFELNITLDEMPFAQMLGSRHAFRNYNAFLNPGPSKVQSIFSVMGLAPENAEISFCGTGALNPLENDPHFTALGIGSPILVNGGAGFILGTGTRSSYGRPNLMTSAPLKGMKPEYMGGFKTSNGPEVICSVGAAIPVLNSQILDQVLMRDSEIPLNLVDIIGRSKIGETNYGEAWKGDWAIGFKRGFCKDCELNSNCPIVEHCPTACFSIEGGIDKSKCFNCGACSFLCPYHAFTGNLGAIKYQNQAIPITLRQSDRIGAIHLMNALKAQILDRTFPIVPPTVPIVQKK